MNGSSQNAYLIEEEKTVLIDTVWTPHRFDFVENLKQEIDISEDIPGPANLCSLSDAMKYGKKQALLQWRGLFIGYAVVSICSAFVAYFLGGIFEKSIRTLSECNF